MRRLFLVFILFTTYLSATNIYATFDVVAKRSANLAFSASGIVKKIDVDIGSVVKKGDILSELENEDIKAILDKTKIDYKFAKREFQREQKIKNLIDESRFDKVLSNYEKAKSLVAYQQALYNKTTLKAPFDGVIFEKNIEIGDAVSAMTLKTVFKIQSLHKRKLILEFDQKYANLVKVGAHFRYRVDSSSKMYDGIISKIYPYANYNNRKIKAEVEANDLMVGLFGEGYIIVDGK